MKHSTKIFNCKNCNLEKKVSHQSFNMYCSNKCKGEGQHKETIRRFYLGEISDRDTLRKILKGLFGNICQCCKLDSEYNGQPITMQVDHQDGNAGNNFPYNVRLLCPNCHSQSPNFGARNKGNGRKARGLPLK